MNIKDFKFPTLTALDLAFSTLSADPQLLAEAKKRGFYNGQTPYNKLFSELFYSGGKLNFKKDLDLDFAELAVPYLKSFMGSFAPKHEEKDAISALLLSELVDI